MHDPRCPVDPPRMDDSYCFWCEVIAKARADEQAKVYAFATRMVLRRGEYLREKVEALPVDHDAYDVAWVVQHDVLALFDELSDSA